MSQATGAGAVRYGAGAAIGLVGGGELAYLAFVAAQARRAMAHSRS